MTHLLRFPRFCHSGHALRDHETPSDSLDSSSGMVFTFGERGRAFAGGRHKASHVRFINASLSPVPSAIYTNVSFHLFMNNVLADVRNVRMSCNCTPTQVKRTADVSQVSRLRSFPHSRVEGAIRIDVFSVTSPPLLLRRSTSVT